MVGVVSRRRRGRRGCSQNALYEKRKKKQSHLLDRVLEPVGMVDKVL